jgi:hypothetical protein
MVTVTAQITDPSGVLNAALLAGGTFVAGTTVDGGFYTFQLDASKADVGIEAPYKFYITANDSLGHVADAGATRNIDDAAPDASVQVFKGTAVPSGPGVTYPAAVANTGWDGTQFIYSDNVRVKGTLTDVSGISDAGLHIDGIDTSGAVTRGTSQSLGCDGGPVCSFDVTVALNAVANGAFHSRSAMRPMGDLNAPSAPMQVVIDASDDSKTGTGASARHSASGRLAAQTTRLLWQMNLPASVSGLAVRPDGDLVATLDGGTDTVYDLAADHPEVRWTWGSDAGVGGMGPIGGTPAVGTGDATSARIYVAGVSGSIYALDRNGVAVWNYDTGDTFAVGPAVARQTNPSPATDVVIVPGAKPPATPSNVYAASSTSISSQLVGDADVSSAPLVFGGPIYYGTQTTVARHTLSASGVLGAATAFNSFSNAPYFEVMTDGVNVIAWRFFVDTSVNYGLVSMTPTGGGATSKWRAPLTPSAPPVVTLNGSLLVPLSGGQIDTVDVSNGNPSQFAAVNLGSSGRTPLVAWDGQLAHQHFYFPRDTGSLSAYTAAGQLSWSAGPNGNSYRAVTMDCSGRLFGATNDLTGGQSLVYALISDDKGLADTVWPSYRGDARNTGNAAAPKYGIRTATGCAQ